MVWNGFGIWGVCFYGYSNPGYEQQIEQFNIASGGQSVNTGGDTTVTSGGGSGVSDSHGGLNEGYQGTRIAPIPRGGGAGQRGLFSTGSSAVHIQEIQISTLGNASNFGQLTVDRTSGGVAGNGIRGITFGGRTPSYVDTIDYVEFANRGNAADFGNLTVARGYSGSLANDTRGINAGEEQPSKQDVIDYITIATIGNAADYGDFTTPTTTTKENYKSKWRV